MHVRDPPISRSASRRRWTGQRRVLHIARVAWPGGWTSDANCCHDGHVCRLLLLQLALACDCMHGGPRRVSAAVYPERASVFLLTIALPGCPLRRTRLCLCYLHTCASGSNLPGRSLLRPALCTRAVLERSRPSCAASPCLALLQCRVPAMSLTQDAGTVFTLFVTIGQHLQARGGAYLGKCSRRLHQAGGSVSVMEHKMRPQRPCIRECAYCEEMSMNYSLV